jgi:hypothetical protein
LILRPAYFGLSEISASKSTNLDKISEFKKFRLVEAILGIFSEYPKQDRPWKLFLLF